MMRDVAGEGSVLELSAKGQRGVRHRSTADTASSQSAEWDL